MAESDTVVAAEPVAKTVAYENFQAVVQAKSGLEAQVASLKTQVQELSEKAATVDTVAARAREWEAKASEAEGRYATYTEFSAALGTTDTEIIGLFDSKYRAMPEAERPARSAWVQAIKAKPDEAPALLRPWLAPAQPEPVQAPRAPAPRVPGTPPTPPATAAPVSDVEVRRIREECVKTGNWVPWQNYKKAAGLSK